MTIEMLQCPFECHTLLPDVLPLVGNAWLEGKLIFLKYNACKTYPTNPSSGWSSSQTSHQSKLLAPVHVGSACISEGVV